MLTLLGRQPVKCFACEQVVRSRVDRRYRLAFLIFFGGGAFTYWVGLPFGGPYYSPWTIAFDGIFYTLFLLRILTSPNAHSCARCGCRFVKPVR